MAENKKQGQEKQGQDKQDKQGQGQHKGQDK